MSLLSRLPDVLIQDVITSWLQMQDVAQFDTAVNSKMRKVWWESALSSSSLSIQQCRDKPTAFQYIHRTQIRPQVFFERFEWAKLRNVRVTNFALFEFFYNFGLR